MNKKYEPRRSRTNVVKLHRNSQKRIYFDDAVYFISCKTGSNYPFSRERIFCDLFVENLRICKELKGFLLYAWVLVYDHFHLLAKTNDEFDVATIMHFLKRHTSRNINIIIGNTPIPNIQLEGEDGHPRLRRIDVSIIDMVFNEYILKFRFKFKYLNQNPFPKFKWQSSYHDHIIRNDDDFEYHFEYIKFNIKKHDLPKKWPYIFTNPDFVDLTDNIY